MSRRPVIAALVASLVLAIGATACASSGGPTGPIAALPPRVGAVKIDPVAGPIGTLFTLTAQGLSEGEVVAFEITFPGEGKAYPGAALTVLADRAATTTYRATTANQPGEYLVRLTGPPGSLAEGRFRVTDGPPVVSTVVDDAGPSSSGPSTSGRTGATRSIRSTTTSAGTGRSTTSTKAAGATTTRRPTTSLAATTTKAIRPPG